MGDVLMTTPAIRALREGAAGRHITLLTSPAGAAIAQLVPEIDAVLVYEAPWMKAGDDRGADYDRAFVAQLAAQRFDAAVIFTVYSQNPLPAAMLCRLAGIPLVLAHCRERAYRLLSDAVPETEPEAGIRHEVRRQLDLVATIGCVPSSELMSLQPTQADHAAAAALIARHALTGRWAVVHPGASAASRRWPPDNYADALALLGVQGWRFVLTGDAGETALCAEIIAASATAAINLAGALSLGETAALIGAAPLVVANNTGPAHIAAAMGTAIVDLYALTNPQHTPWAVAQRVLSHDVECRWCYASICRTGHHMCLRGVTAQQVVEAARELVP